MSNIKPFLVPPPDDPASNHPELFETLRLAKSATQMVAPIESEIQLSDEEINALREATLPDSIRLIDHYDPIFQEHQAALDRQVKAVEEIAQTAKFQADQALKQAIISKEKLELSKEQVELISSIARDAKSQADTTLKELETMKEDLRLAKSAAGSSEKEATFSKILAILAIAISIIMPILTDVIVPLLLSE